MASRDLELAQIAFDQGDVEASIRAHDSKKKYGQLDQSEDAHSDHGDFVKSLIFGGLDGIITTFAIVAAVAGSNMDTDVVILMGIANLMADGISMGLGDYLSEMAENNFVNKEREREMWETNNHLEGEKQEMIEIYMTKGLSEEDATSIINTMAKYKDFFVDHMMVMELGLMPVEQDDEAWKKGAVTFFSFLTFGSVPVLTYVIFRGVDFGNSNVDWVFIISIISTLITIFFLGICQGLITKQNVWVSGGRMLLNGGLAATVSYLLGYLLKEGLDL